MIYAPCGSYADIGEYMFGAAALLAAGVAIGGAAVGMCWRTANEKLNEARRAESDRSRNEVRRALIERLIDDEG